jgi:hypothetical protein
VEGVGGKLPRPSDIVSDHVGLGAFPYSPDDIKCARSVDIPVHPVSIMGGDHVRHRILTNTSPGWGTVKRDIGDIINLRDLDQRQHSS